MAIKLLLFLDGALQLLAGDRLLAHQHRAVVGELLDAFADRAPARHSVAPLLAEMGYQVVLLDKARHPRFHIGESMLPAAVRIWKRLGLWPMAALNIAENALSLA